MAQAEECLNWETPWQKVGVVCVSAGTCVRKRFLCTNCVCEYWAGLGNTVAKFQAFWEINESSVTKYATLENPKLIHYSLPKY